MTSPQACGERSAPLKSTKTRVIEQNVDGPEPAHCGVDHGLHLRLLGDISLDCDRFREARSQRFGVVLVTEIVHTDGGPGLREPFGDRVADPTAGSGHDGNLSAEVNVRYRTRARSLWRRPWLAPPLAWRHQP